MERSEVTIKVRYLNDMEPLKEIEMGNAIDVRCAEDTHLKMFEYKQIPLGFSCQLPEGYMALVIPRSSTFKKYGIIQTNSVGLIDTSYCGDNDQWCMPVVSLKADAFIPKGERIAQFLVLPVPPRIHFETVDSLDNPDRGGFGSTGRL